MHKLSFICNICANTFTKNGHLKIHKLSFKCNICGCLQMHKLLFKCNICANTFSKNIIIVICNNAQKKYLHAKFVLIDLLRMVIRKCTNLLFTCNIFG